MSAIDITNTLIEKYNTATEFKAATAATVDTAGGTEEFKYTPTGKANKVVFGVAVAASNGAVKVKFTKALCIRRCRPRNFRRRGKTTVVQVEQADLFRQTEHSRSP